MVSDLSQVLELSPPIILALLLNFLGLGLKKSPVPNWMIPLVLILIGATIFPLIADVSKVSFQCKNPVALNAVYGATIGGFAVGLNQAFRQLLLRFGWKDEDEPKPPDPPAGDPLTRSQASEMLTKPIE